MLQGSVKFFNATKGFGFITKDNGSDIFFHITEVEGGQEPQTSDKVSFYEGTGKKGPMAVEIKLI